MIGVRTGLGDYRVAVAELPLSLILDDGPSADIVVSHGVPTSVPPTSVLVVADPQPGHPTPSVDGTSVVVDRSWLRADAVADAGTHPDAVLFVAECSSSAADRDALIRDALGWLRELSGESLVLETATSTPYAVLAQLRAGDRPVTLMATTHSDAAGRQVRLRVTAVGVRRAEVVVSDCDVSIEVSTRSGSTRRPVRQETRQRLSLRRAVAAVGGARADDLRVLAEDEELAARVLGGHKSH